MLRAVGTSYIVLATRFIDSLIERQAKVRSSQARASRSFAQPWRPRARIKRHGRSSDTHGRLHTRPGPPSQGHRVGGARGGERGRRGERPCSKSGSQAVWARARARTRGRARTILELGFGFGFGIGFGFGLWMSDLRRRRRAGGRGWRTGRQAASRREASAAAPVGRGGVVRTEGGRCDEGDEEGAEEGTLTLTLSLTMRAWASACFWRSISAPRS